jgi:hypothetical protein
MKCGTMYGWWWCCIDYGIMWWCWIVWRWRINDFMVGSHTWWHGVINLSACLFTITIIKIKMEMVFALCCFCAVLCVCELWVSLHSCSEIGPRSESEQKQNKIKYSKIYIFGVTTKARKSTFEFLTCKKKKLGPVSCRISKICHLWFWSWGWDN